MRLLPCIRLSVLDDASTSPERQVEKIGKYAQALEHELVPITDRDYDLDVSGAVSPFNRPGLGPWLKDDRLDTWDAICVAKLDRLTRSLFDFVNLVSWLEARGKTLICLDPQLDLSTPAGRTFASVTMSFAQFERETIAARVREGYHKVISQGRYAGGQVPFGYRPTKRDTGGWGYEVDPVYGPILAEICDRYVRYESLGSITRWLNETGIPTPWNVTRLRTTKPAKDAMWRTTSLRKILMSPAMLGAVVSSDGTMVRDDQGVVIYRADPIVSRDVYERVQARLAANPVSAKVNSWLLTQVAFCAVCEAAMYGTTAKYREKDYRYYGCVHSIRRDGVCTARRVHADELETVIADELLALVGDLELTTDRMIACRDYSEEIARVAEQIGHLFAEIQVEALSGTDVREKQETLQRAQAELARLHSLEPVKALVEPVSTGQTFRQMWASLDDAGRNEYLRANAVRAVVSHDELPAIEPYEGPLTAADIPRMAIIDQPKLHVVIYLENLGEMLRRASSMSATGPTLQL